MCLNQLPGILNAAKEAPSALTFSPVGGASLFNKVMGKSTKKPGTPGPSSTALPDTRIGG